MILVVDDDPEVVRAVARDMRLAFGEHFQIVRADSGAAALEATRQLKLQNRPVALLLSDQRMPGMTGVEFLEQATAIFPDAKRVLLTAYADTEAAIRAINAVKLDYYLMKPWHPPELNLYPVVDELLSDWQADCAPPFDGLRLIDSQWSRGRARAAGLSRPQPDSLSLARRRDGSGSARADRLSTGTGAGECSLDDGRALPFVILPDGERLRRPTTGEVAERLGISHASAHAVLQRAHRRRWSRRPRGRCLRRLRRSVDGDPREGRARRPGRAPAPASRTTSAFPPA